RAGGRGDAAAGADGGGRGTAGLPGEVRDDGGDDAGAGEGAPDRLPVQEEGGGGPALAGRGAELAAVRAFLAAAAVRGDGVPGRVVPGRARDRAGRYRGQHRETAAGGDRGAGRGRRGGVRAGQAGAGRARHHRARRGGTAGRAGDVRGRQGRVDAAGRAARGDGPQGRQTGQERGQTARERGKA